MQAAVSRRPEQGNLHHWNRPAVLEPALFSKWVEDVHGMVEFCARQDLGELLGDSLPHMTGRLYLAGPEGTGQPVIGPELVSLNGSVARGLAAGAPQDSSGSKFEPYYQRQKVANLS